MSKVSLFLIPKKVLLTQGDMGVPRMNFPLNQSDFKIYRQITNNIDFLVKNIDRKPLNVVGKRLMITIFDDRTNSTLLQKHLVIVDDTKGQTRLILSPSEIQDFPVGFIRYAVIIENEDGTQNPAYIDQNQRIKGYFEFLDDALPTFKESILVKGGNPTDAGYDGDFYSVSIAPGVTEWRSGAFPGNQQNFNLTGLHTFAVYVTNFKARFWIQGSLSNEPSLDDNDWFDIIVSDDGEDYVTFSEDSGIFPYNVISNLYWIRFKYILDIDNQGQLDKIYYRN